MFRVRRTAPAALAVVAVALLGACGGDDPPAGGAAGAGADDGGGAAGGKLDPCSIVPAAAAEKVLGGPAGDPQDVSVSGEARCQYDAEGGANLIVATAPASSFDTFVEFFKATPVDGIGEKAAEVRGGIYVISAVKGENLVQFSVGPGISETGKVTPVDHDAARALMRDSLRSL